MCTINVGEAPFRAYCTPLYTAHLWRAYRKRNMQRLNVAYNDGMRMLLKLPRWCRASEMFVNVGMPNCSVVLCNLMYKFMCRLSASGNDIIIFLCDGEKSSLRFSSRVRSHWHSSLYVRADTWCLSLRDDIWLIIIAMIVIDVCFDRIAALLFLLSVINVCFICYRPLVRCR